MIFAMLPGFVMSEGSLIHVFSEDWCFSPLTLLHDLRHITGGTNLISPFLLFLPFGGGTREGQSMPRW